ncbi:MAG: hypothetical protein ACK47B_03385 [Armatimonadota bacterium]
MPKKILVVIPESHVARLVEVNLRRLGHQVLVARTSAAAQALARTEAPDLVLVDVLTAFGATFDLLRELKSDPHTAGIEVRVIQPGGLLAPP